MDKEQVIKNCGSLSLAYIGDAAYELVVREYILKSGISANGKMHIRAKQFVSACAQSGFLQKISPYLTEEEAAVIRRGRNAKPHSHPKGAALSDYHNATGFESLWGYLYLTGNKKRMDELFDIIVQSEAE